MQNPNAQNGADDWRESQTAFGLFVRREQAALLRVCVRLLCGDRSGAEDVTQEAFLRLWERRERLAPETNARAYLFTTARNLCRDRFRAPEVRRGDVWLDAAPLPIADNAPAPDAAIEAATLADAVREALRRLPEEQRAVFVLSEYERMLYREIGEILGCPVGTVASRKAQAVKSLRQMLREWRDEG